jgi:hypothetical protein
MPAIRSGSPVQSGHVPDGIDTLIYVAGAEMEQAISDEVLGEERIVFAFLVTLPDGRHYIEHVILHLAGGKIARQVDVEMWD